MVNGWIEKPLSELFNFSGGLSASRADLSTKGHPYLHYGDIHGSVYTFVDVCADGSIPRLDVDLSKVSKVSLLNNGDVVFVDASEDDDGASKHIVIRNADEIPFISGLHTIVAKAKTGELDNLFREFCFQSTAIKSQFKFYAVGTKVTGVSKTNIGKIVLCYPKDKAEQRRIAAAISDIDALISALEKLIAKKRSIKQGAMQELLTGKRRLPGFSGEWVETTIGEFIDIISGGTPSTSIPEFWDGDISWCTPTDITKSRSKYLSDTERTITEKGLMESAAILLPVGTILFCSRATIGEMCIATKPIATNQGFKNLVCGSEVDNEFLYYLLQTKISAMLELAIGSTFLEISKRALASIQIEIPCKPEQTAIAEVLSDMDAEIDVMTARLTKLRKIKQGMMSELLTGRIRLKEDTENGEN